MKIAYTVACQFTDAAVADRWLEWLRSEHLADVCAAGALDARAVRLDGDEIHCEARYTFASRQAFETYEREQAPRLREEGLHLFPLDLGLTYSRSTGEILAESAA